MKITGPTIAAVIFGVLVVGFSVYQQWGTQNTSIQNQTPERTDTDTDGDGIADWEETLIGLDPNKTDSDDDGISDSEALAQARAVLRGETQTNTEADMSLNKTDILARELIGAYIQAKQFGNYDPELFKNIVAVSAQNQFKTSAPTYTIADLSHTNTTPQNAETYVHDVREILDPLTKIPEYELETFARASKNNNATDYDTLRANAVLYKKTAEQLLSVSVPEDAVETHLLLINGLSTFSHALQLLADSADDPAQSFVAIKAFLESEEQVRAAFAGISVYHAVNTHSSL